MKEVKYLWAGIHLDLNSLVYLPVTVTADYLSDSPKS